MLSQEDPFRKFSSFSAFCNAKGKIYISGGEAASDDDEQTNSLSNFMAIDLTNINNSDFNPITLPDLNEARTWHSMIYIPDDYVFIVSGTGVKSVEVYDISKNTIEKDSELNEARSECTLCYVNNCYLYAFCGFLFHQKFVTSIERCNLKREKRTWEYVNMKFDNGIEFTPSFFSVAYYGDKLILLGGNENNEENYPNYLVTFDEENDSIDLYNTEKKIVSVFREKFFIPVDENRSFLMPLVSNEIEVLIMNQDSGKIEQKGEKDGINNINLDNLLVEENRGEILKEQNYDYNN